MKKSILKFILPICILLVSVCNPVFAYHHIGHSSFNPNNPQEIALSTSKVQHGSLNHHASITHTFGDFDKVLKLTTTESEEEENEPVTLKKVEHNAKVHASFYLLSLLFLFSYLENSPNLHRLFSFSPIENRRFVLFQVFRL